MPKSKYEFQRNLAVIVGINNYSNGIPMLETAVPDATEIARILKQDYKYEVRLLLDKDASLEELIQLLVAFQMQKIPLERETVMVSGNDRVLFYFAGHGIALDALESQEGPAGYLIPHNAHAGNISTYLLMQELHNALVSLPCRHLLTILDCCFAGAFRWSSLKRDIVPSQTVYKERYERFISDRAWQVITSAAHDQKALDFLACRGTVDQHSPFAAALLRALHGGADTNPPAKNGKPAGDGVITATELYSYLRDELETTTEKFYKRQTPGLFQLSKHDKGEYIFLVPGHELNLPPAPPLNRENNPYRGLKPFDKAHSHLFFGRQEVVKDLSAFVNKHQLTVVLGASGTGKSSLVKAGLIPNLENAVENQWQVLEPIRPGEFPMTALARANLQMILGATPEDTASIDAYSQDLRQETGRFALDMAAWSNAHPQIKLLLVVDQFEELVTMCHSEQERQQFLKALEAALKSNQLYIVLTLRSDFEPQFFNSAFSSQWMDARFLLRPMTQDELREVIEKPAVERVLYFNPPDLVERLINEVVQMPGALPLLSFTLSELYLKYLERRGDDRALTEFDYFELGSVAGSLTQRATQEYRNLVKVDPAYEHTVRQVMLRMVTVEGGELARRRVPKSELVYESVEENNRVKTVIECFSAARLLVEGKEIGDEAYVEPAHDALVRGWNKLQQWKNSQQESLVLRQRLTPAANDWQNQQHSSDYLWSNDPRLPVLEKVLKSAFEGNWLNKLEIEFVKQSIQKRHDELEETKERLRISEERRVEAEKQNAIALSRSSEAFFGSNQQLEALVAGVKAGRKLQKLLAENAISQESLTIKQTAINLQRIIYSIRERNRLEGHSGPVQSVSFSPDGSVIATASWDNTVKLWSQEGRLLRTFKGHKDGVLSNSFSPDGKTIASTGWDNTIKLWNLEGQELTTLRGHTNQIWSVSFSPDGEIIASTSMDATVKLWSKDGGELKTLKGHSSTVRSVSFSPDGTILASSSFDGTVKLWNLDGTLIKTLTHGGTVYSISFSPDGKLIASASSDKTVKIWSLNGETRATLKGHGSGVTSVSFSPRSSILASGSSDNTVKLWSLNGQEIATLKGHTAELTSVSFHPDGNTIASASEDSTVKIWNLHQQKIPILCDNGQEATRVCFSPDGKTIASDVKNTVKLWKLNSLERKTLSGHSYGIASLSFSPDGKFIASGSFDKTVKLWSQDGQVLKTLFGHAGAVRSVCFSPNNQLIVTGSDDKTAKLWNQDGQEIATFTGHTGGIWSVSFSPDGKMIASGSDGSDKTIKLWSIDGQELKTLEGHSSTINKVSFSPNGEIMASASSDNTVKLWSINGQEIRTLRGHSYQVFDVSFTSDGQMIASADWDGTIKLWNLEGQLLVTLERQSNKISSLSFSPDNQILAAATNKGIILWNFNLDNLVEFGCKWLHNYLLNNPNVKEDRNLCNIHVH
ncbi:peptidase C14 [Scytonema sp. UIC 10036]|uniref:nSTAND1 domain-containing NTPase n=1 Tax=Scytonema sp. UIC 10036 TaxID=2304196 RepID=UPI0012DA3B56|nr:caspase family protein [Scytonema sp. UIC 10036]MUG91485.1 peptidase C14 [Scytonema sp. UIC 10036]